MGRRGKDPNALVQQSICFLEGEGDLGGGARCFRRVGHAPMGRHGLAGPDRACLGRGAIADSEHEIEFGGAEFGELSP